jgi:uncharacterized protein
MIPTVETCLRLMDEYRMLDNIKDHSKVVARVAELITSGLRQLDVAIDLDLVMAGALLHDIAKTQCLDSRCDHAKVGGAICRELGFPETAEVVAEHVMLKSSDSGRITEKEIIYYSDKRVNHDKVVSLHDRLDYILDRYARDNVARQDLIRRNFDKCLDVEKRIFAGLGYGPEQVAALVMSRGDWRV